MTPVLSVKNLSIDFLTPSGPVHALREVNLSVSQNRIVGIVGESGSGKSTVASAVMRLLANNADVRTGEIEFEGRDILAMSESELRTVRGEEIAMVFQDPMTAQTPVLSIGQQMIDIQYRRSLSIKEKRQKAIDMLTRVGIPDPSDRMDQYPHQLSGGMRQRISIAMSLMMSPKLLIADEPTTALDVTLEAQIIHLFRELRKSFDGSIIVVSHNLGLIAELCDEVVVMYAGEVVERATVDDIFHRAAHPYTQALLDCDPARLDELTEKLPTITGDVPDLQGIPAGCIFASRCDQKLQRCTSKRPPLVTITESHDVRCHLLNND
ncbi:MAG: ABC transporter ATP-binding protein [Arenicellales bacterium]|nr:ABC transporter ATP-binding protein [Arenicellales bacterium]